MLNHLATVTLKSFQNHGFPRNNLFSNRATDNIFFVHKYTNLLLVVLKLSLNRHNLIKQFTRSYKNTLALVSSYCFCHPYVIHIYIYYLYLLFINNNLFIKTVRKMLNSIRIPLAYRQH